MKVIAFAQRLLRDWKSRALSDLDAVARLELLDAINGGLQALHELAPHHSKITTGALAFAVPTTISIAVTDGSNAFTGYTVLEEDLYCTVRIDGDAVDNQIAGTGNLLHPYSGTSGTVSATIYHDACLIPEPYVELVGNPRIIETRREVLPYPGNTPFTYWTERQIKEPSYYVVEANARNNNPHAPAVFRTDSLPDRGYRMQVPVKLAPLRVSMLDLVGSDTDIPLRAEHVETYLLPVCAGLMAKSELWANPETIDKAGEAAEDAKARYATNVPAFLSTPAHRVGTPYGW